MNKENKEKVKPNVCLIKDCNRLIHKKSKYCIFHASVEEKTEKEFIEALKEYVDKIKEEDKDYDFKGFIFVGDINFREDLSITIFKNANFWEATFEGNATFRGVTFNEDALFEEAAFEGDVIFRDATFMGNALFWKVTFEGDAIFLVKSFEKDVNFAKANLFPGKKLNLIVKKKGVIYFDQAFLGNVLLDIDLYDEALIDFTDALLRNTKFTKSQIEKHIIQEEKKEFSQAREVYLLLKNNFHSIGRYEDESWAFKKEKDMERKSYFHFKSLHKWLWSCFLNGIFGYGEQPGKVIISAISIILIFTILFMSSGINDTSLGDFTSKNFLDCVYFSVITFTTLGYGDFRPLEGCGRIFAGTEAFIGALMMALFVYTFARKTGGR